MSDIAERLRGYNPPDRVDQWSPVCGATLLSIARDIHDGADEIERLRAEVARLMAERETERMRLAAWPEIHAERPTWSDLIARLRTTAEVLRLCQWALREPLDNWKGECERKALDASCAILAQLEKEGLT